MAAGDGNGQKVTVAVLGTKIDALTEKVSEAMDDAKEDRRAQADVNTTINTRVTRIEERMGIWGVAQAAYTTVAAALAGFLGSRQ